MVYFKRHIFCAAPLAFIRLQSFNQAVAPIVLNCSCHYVRVSAFDFGIPAESFIVEQYGLDQKYDVQVTLSVSECLADLSILDGMETVFVSGVHSHERNIILKHCVGKGINMFVIPRVGDVIMSGAWPMHMFHLPMLRVGRYMASPEFLFVKRAISRKSFKSWSLMSEAVMLKKLAAQ